jgi:hypothetical protein
LHMLWSQYISMCRKKGDLFDLLQEKGIGQFQSSIVIEMANFYEKEGDVDCTPLLDYRRANLRYQSSIKNIKTLI